MKSDVFEPKIVAFCCHYCAYASADLAGSMRIQYPPNVRIIRTPCTGRLETEYFMKAFENGADGVLVAGCLEGGCHFVEGNLCAKRRVNYTRECSRKSASKRNVSAWSTFPPPWPAPGRTIITDMVETVRKLGPQPDEIQRQTSTGEVAHDCRPKKKHPRLLSIVKAPKKVLLLGCGTCVTVCLAGGQREVSIIASALRMAAKLKNLALEVEELTIERQCDNVFLEQAAEAASARPTLCCRSAAAPVCRPWPSVSPANRFTRASTPPSSAFWKNGASGRKNARPAARVCSISTAASAPVTRCAKQC